MERGGFKKILLNLYHIKNLNGKRNLTRTSKVMLEEVIAKRRFQKDPIESISNLKKIVQGKRKDPMQSYKILQEFYGILAVLNQF